MTAVTPGHTVYLFTKYFLSADTNKPMIPNAKAVTSISIPENLLTYATQLSPGNRAFVIRATTGAFIRSNRCNLAWIAAIPLQEKIKVLTMTHVGGDLAGYKAWGRVAKKATPRKSVSQLISAALYWKQQIAT